MITPGVINVKRDHTGPAASVVFLEDLPQHNVTSGSISLHCCRVLAPRHAGGIMPAMVSRRVLRSYQARYSMGANKASMYDLTDAIDVHAHARGHDEEEPLHAAQEASRARIKAILFKSISH